MFWSDLPPAGNPIFLANDTTEAPGFAGYGAVWVASGTAALALALAVARQRHPEIASPEVVLPGYGCPDLVAAAVYAGVQPVLADIGAADPGYDLESLQQALSGNTIAVVAVNFLGIRERLSELRALLRNWPAATLIEDNAQWFPEPFAAAELQEEAVVLSFGRGKPVSLLGGGVLLLRDSYLPITATEPFVEPPVEVGTALRWKIRAYNLLLRPLLYGMISRNPLLQLGRTVYKPLRGITALDSQRKVLLARNVQRHLNRSQTPAAFMHALLPASMDLPAQLGERSGRLLRYPVLCSDVKQRDALQGKLRCAGLGSSTMYQRVLTQIEGVVEHVKAAPDLRGASSFAGRLLTLPTHSGVSAATVTSIEAIFRGVC